MIWLIWFLCEKIRVKNSHEDENLAVYNTQLNKWWSVVFECVHFSWPHRKFNGKKYFSLSHSLRIATTCWKFNRCLKYLIPQGKELFRLGWLSEGLFEYGLANGFCFVRKTWVNSATSARDRISNNNDSNAQHPRHLYIVFRHDLNDCVALSVHSRTPLCFLFHP